MNYDVIPLPSFNHSVKKLLKQFHSIKDDIKEAVRSIESNAQHGDLIPGGHGVRKIRQGNSDTGTGKRYGYRLLYFYQDQPNKIIYLLLIYAKSEKKDVTIKELQNLLNELKIFLTAS